MEFEFDPGKARTNLQKHGIAFAELEPVFLDPCAFTNRSDRKTVSGEMEERYVTTGVDALGRVVTVAWTPRSGKIRLISARCAREEEKAGYEQR